MSHNLHNRVTRVKALFLGTFYLLKQLQQPKHRSPLKKNG